jgi:hypothetical protein
MSPFRPRKGPAAIEEQLMRKDLMDILACPVCKSPLELTSEE